MRSPLARYGGGAAGGGGNNIDVFDTSPPEKQQQHRVAISAGGPSRARFTKENEVNPFDHEYNNNDTSAGGAYGDAFEKKGAQIRIAEEGAGAEGLTPQPQQFGQSLVRSVTADSSAAARGSAGEEERKDGGGGGGGFLNRMRSLRGGKRGRMVRRDTST